MDEKKLLAGFVHCVTGHPNDCSDCPYNMPGVEPMSSCAQELINDAYDYIAKLKVRIDELERPKNARILSLEEAKALRGEVIWQDFGYCSNKENELMGIIPACVECVEFRTPYIDDGEIECFIFTDGYDEVASYGTQEVFWTARPTEAQRKEYWDTRR